MSDEGQFFFCPSRKKNTAGGRDGPIESPSHREVEVVVKSNTSGGSVGRAQKVFQNPHSVQADTHDYFLPRPKAGRFHPASKSGPDMIISRGDLRLVGSTRHRKVVQNPHSIYYFFICPSSIQYFKA